MGRTIDEVKADRAIGRIIGHYLDDDYLRYFENRWMADRDRRRAESLRRKARRAEKLAGSLLTHSAF